MIKDRSLALWTAEASARSFAKNAHMRWEDVTGKRRLRRVVAVRHSIAQHLRRTTDLSLPEIGRILKRDHSTVLAMVRKGQCLQS